jgi:hypothetical protein
MPMQDGEGPVPQSYSEGWRDYRRRVRILSGSWLGGLVFILFTSLASVLGRVFPLDRSVFGLVWLAAFMISGVRLATWRCPRCGSWFFARGSSWHPFTRACLHCGLPKMDGGTAAPIRR